MGLLYIPPLDSSVIANLLHRTGNQAITTSETQITFSSSLASNDYVIDIIDPDGVGWEKPTDIQASGFKIKGLSSGTINYVAILRN